MDNNIFFHASNNKFEEFSLNNNKLFKEIDLPVWFFTKDLNYAKTYGSYVYEVKLNLGKVFDTNKKEHLKMFINYLKNIENKTDEEIEAIMDEQFYNGLPYWTCEDAYYAAISNDFNSILIQEELSKEVLSVGVFNVNQIQILNVLNESKVLKEYNKKDLAPLPSFQLHKELNSAIWDDNNKLNSNIRSILLKVAKDFINDYLDKDLEFEDIILTGSIANYNYSKYSDYDVHIVFDFSKIDKNIELVEDFLYSKKQLWNEAHNIIIKGYEVELYCQDINAEHNATGIYSLLNNEWVVEPEALKEEDIDEEELQELKQSVIEVLKELDVLFKTKDYKQLQKYFDKLVEKRKKGIEKNGELDKNNLIYKFLRRNGYFNKILRNIDLFYDKEVESLVESFNLLKEEENKDAFIFPLKIYSVLFSTESSSDTIYYGTDYEEAKEEFESWSDVPDGWENRTDMMLLFQFVENEYKFVDLEDIESQTKEGQLEEINNEFPVEVYYDDSTYYELVNEGFNEDIETRDISPANEDSDELLDEVQSYYKEKYGHYKYNNISVEDEDGNYVGTIQLRISDHTENIFNNDRFGGADYYISVVIADFDATNKRFGFSNDMERRRNEFSIKFNSETDFDEIIEEINFNIEELSEELKG